MEQTSISNLNTKTAVNDNDYLIIDDLSSTNKILAKTILDTCKQELLNKLYPVGSIYMSVNSTSPATLFGGTWEQIKDRFLLGSGSKSLSATGGEESHTLTTAEMPKHTHSWSIPIGGYSGWSSKSMSNYVFKWSNDTVYNTNAGTSTINCSTTNLNGGNGNTGSSQAHNNMPPYLVVNIWKRTA